MKMLGVILAGGRSTRMGSNDKALLPFAEGTLISHVQSRLEMQMDNLVLNTNADPEPFLKLGLPIYNDSFEGFAGPLAGVLTGMTAAKELGFSHVLTVAADTPFFPMDLKVRFETKFEDNTQKLDHQIVLAETLSDSDRRNFHPTFGAWDVTLEQDLNYFLQEGGRKVLNFVEKYRWSSTLWDSETIDPFFNVNRPEDLEMADRIYQEHLK